MVNKLRKRFGQHLLVDSGTISNIVQAINPLPQQNIYEIGAGLGAITLPILQRSNAMHAIEIDRDLSKKLLEKCKDAGELTLHQTDVLKFNFADIAKPEEPLRLVGNLPYNISTPLIFHLLQFSNLIKDMHFMLQKEVVDRITATAGTPTYSRLSIMVQSYYKVESLFDIAPAMFSPPPKVISSFMRLLPCNDFQHKIKDRSLFNKIIGTAFQQRRKTIKNSLATIVSEHQLQLASIPTHLRAQEISIHQYITLANQLTK